MALLDRSPEVAARKRGLCKFCNQATAPGQYIVKVDRLGWVHAGCADRYLEFRQIKAAHDGEES